MIGLSETFSVNRQILNTILKKKCLLFIVLFDINCTNQIKSNYLKSHGEEAQEKPPGL